jgi:hypothetical protein
MRGIVQIFSGGKGRRVGFSCFLTSILSVASKSGFVGSFSPMCITKPNLHFSAWGDGQALRSKKDEGRVVTRIEILGTW